MAARGAVERVAIRGACVYMIVHNDSGRIYFGKTVDHESRWTKHVWASRQPVPRTRVARALRTYGADAFTFTVLQRFRTERRAYEAERHLVALFRTTDPGHGFNVRDGGEGITSRDAQITALVVKQKADEAEWRGGLKELVVDEVVRGVVLAQPLTENDRLFWKNLYDGSDPQNVTVEVL